MKRSVLILVWIGLMTVGAFAQPGEAMDGRRRQQIESARIAFLTDRLDITPTQAQQFWPIYNELEDKRSELRKEMRQKREEAGLEVSDEEARTLIGEFMAMRQQELDLEKEYSDRMMEVLSPQQVLKLKQSEEDFRQFIIRELRERHRNGRAENRRGSRSGR